MSQQFGMICKFDDEFDSISMVLYYLVIAYAAMNVIYDLPYKYKVE